MLDLKSMREDAKQQVAASMQNPATTIEPMNFNKISPALSAAKFDQGKVMAGVLEDFLPALAEIAKLGSMNNKPNGKYDRGSWMLVEDADTRYNDAFWRHVLAGRHNIDPETGMPHDVAIAWNALALLWFRLKSEGTL